MFVRNFSFISLLLISSYCPKLSGNDQIQVSDPDKIALQDRSNAVDDPWGNDDAFADITIDTNHKPQTLPLWKRTGAWLFMKLYWPMKRVTLWWQGGKSIKKTT